MEPIYDFSWMSQMMTAKVREKFTFNDYKAIGLEIPPKPIERSPYHYRILFFSQDSQKPVLSLNLESSILGSHCLTEHHGKDHLNLGHTDDDLSYDDFKKWAMERAKKELN
jgi:hypothetical protein